MSLYHREQGEHSTMRPLLWLPAIALSAQEEHISQRIKKAKLFLFLREQRHRLFDEAFQNELAQMYRSSKRGHPPIAPAQLALAVILQAYTGVSDDEVIEATMMDRRWQLVLDCLDTDQAPFSLTSAMRLLALVLCQWSFDKWHWCVKPRQGWTRRLSSRVSFSLTEY